MAVREPLLDKNGDPDMRAVAYRLACKHTAGELQQLIDHLTDIIKERLWSLNGRVSRIAALD